MRAYRFAPGWTASLCLAFLLFLFISLGFWQLRRAEEKTAIMAQREQNEREPVLRNEGTEWLSDRNRYRRVEVRGELDSAHQFLLDNQIHDRQAGYHVLTPLRIEGTDAALLVNRGWVPVGADRLKLPDLPTSQAHLTVGGLLDKFPGVGFRLEGAEIPSPGWPSVVQLLDAKALSERLGYRVLPYQLLLAPDEPQGFVRDWRRSDLNPDKNRGYALQWFSFGAVVSVLYVWHGFRPRHKN